MASEKSSQADSATGNPSPYCLAPEVILVPVEDGSARVLDLQGQFFALSEVAAQMLRDTLELGSDGAVRSVVQRWGVDLPRAKADYETFLADLLRQGLLVPAGQPARPPRLRTRLAAALMGVLLRVLPRLQRTMTGKAVRLLALANLSCRWLGWAQTVRLWQRVFKPQRPLDGAAAEEARAAIDQAVRQAITQAALSHACKERGLASWALGRCLGLSPRLTIGINLYPLHGHCWAELGTTYLGDDAERCTQFQPVRTYE
jgi:hypothetical protein